MIGPQPRCQGLSSAHRKGSEERKILVQAGHVPPKKWEGTRKQWEGGVTKSQIRFS